MAKKFLVGLLVAAVLLSSGCEGDVTENYVKKKPRDVGQRVDRLRAEVLPGLNISPATKEGKTIGSSCGDDRTERTVEPDPADPWKVAYNHYKFVSSVIIPVPSAYAAPPIYDRLLQHLKATGGWRTRESRLKDGLLGGVEGTKDDVQVNARDLPDGKGGHMVIVSLESLCYRHPNA